MTIEPLKLVSSRTLVLTSNNIDTDQIMPAKFLSMTTQNGLGVHVFSNLRYTDDGTLTNHELNSVSGKACKILVAGDNFGCGSSREHAPWGLTDYGFRVIISSSIADIFNANALQNGLLPVTINIDVHEWLLRNPGVYVTVNLETCLVELPSGMGSHSFEIDSFSRYCLLEGLDEMGYLLAQSEQISEFEDR